MNIYLIKNKGGSRARYFAATEQRALELAMEHRMARKIENLSVLKSAPVPDDFHEGVASLRVRMESFNDLLARMRGEPVEEPDTSELGVYGGSQKQPNGENWTYPL